VHGLSILTSQVAVPSHRGQIAPISQPGKGVRSVSTWFCHLAPIWRASRANYMEPEMPKRRSTFNLLPTPSMPLMTHLPPAFLNQTTLEHLWFCTGSQLLIQTRQSPLQKSKGAQTPDVVSLQSNPRPRFWHVHRQTSALAKRASDDTSLQPQRSRIGTAGYIFHRQARQAHTAYQRRSPRPL